MPIFDTLYILERLESHYVQPMGEVKWTWTYCIHLIVPKMLESLTWLSLSYFLTIISFFEDGYSRSSFTTLIILSSKNQRKYLFLRKKKVTNVRWINNLLLAVKYFTHCVWFFNRFVRQFQKSYWLPTVALKSNTQKPQPSPWSWGDETTKKKKKKKTGFKLNYR